PLVAPSLAAPIQPLVQQLRCFAIEPDQPAVVVAHSVVGVVPPQFATYLLQNPLRRHYSHLLQPFLQVDELRAKLLPRSCSLHPESFPVFRPAAVVSEPQKIKCSGPLSSGSRLSHRVASKLQHLGL